MHPEIKRELWGNCMKALPGTLRQSLVKIHMVPIPDIWIVPTTSGGRRVRDISASESFSIYSLSAPAPEAERPPVIIKITKFCYVGTPFSVSNAPPTAANNNNYTTRVLNNTDRGLHLGNVDKSFPAFLSTEDIVSLILLIIPQLFA